MMPMHPDEVRALEHLMDLLYAKLKKIRDKRREKVKEKMLAMEVA